MSWDTAWRFSQPSDGVSGMLAGTAHGCEHHLTGRRHPARAELSGRGRVVALACRPEGQRTVARAPEGVSRSGSVAAGAASDGRSAAGVVDRGPGRPGGAGGFQRGRVGVGAGVRRTSGLVRPEDRRLDVCDRYAERRSAAGRPRRRVKPLSPSARTGARDAPVMHDSNASRARSPPTPSARRATRKPRAESTELPATAIRTIPGDRAANLGCPNRVKPVREVVAHRGMNFCTCGVRCAR
jgi:hypothetical protein